MAFRVCALVRETVENHIKGIIVIVAVSAKERDDEQQSKTVKVTVRFQKQSGIEDKTYNIEENSLVLDLHRSIATTVGLAENEFVLKLNGKDISYEKEFRNIGQYMPMVADKPVIFVGKQRGGGPKRRKGDDDDDDFTKTLGKMEKLLLLKNQVTSLGMQQDMTTVKLFTDIAKSLLDGPATTDELLEKVDFNVLETTLNDVAPGDKNASRFYKKLIQMFVPQLAVLDKTMNQFKDARTMTEMAWQYRVSVLFMNESGKLSIDSFREAVKAYRKKMTGIKSMMSDGHDSMMQALNDPHVLAQLMSTPQVQAFLTAAAAGQQIPPQP